MEPDVAGPMEATPVRRASNARGSDGEGNRRAPRSRKHLDGEDRYRELRGTAIEFYDFYIYGTAALVMGGIFPEFSPAAGALAAFVTFAVASVVRPLGGIVFGHFGDRVGRKGMLIFSLSVRAMATT